MMIRSHAAAFEIPTGLGKLGIVAGEDQLASMPSSGGQGLDLVNLPQPIWSSAYMDPSGNIITPVSGGGYIETNKSGIATPKTGPLPTGTYYLSDPSSYTGTIAAPSTLGLSTSTWLAIAAAGAAFLLVSRR